jgi:hypothetical protein
MFELSPMDNSRQNSRHCCCLYQQEVYLDRTVMTTRNNSDQLSLTKRRLVRMGTAMVPHEKKMTETMEMMMAEKRRKTLVYGHSDRDNRHHHVTKHRHRHRPM